MQVWKIGNTATSLILQGVRCPFRLATQRQRLATCCGFLGEVFNHKGHKEHKN
jgi:hypothetical protein